MRDYNNEVDLFLGKLERTMMVDGSDVFQYKPTTWSALYFTNIEGDEVLASLVTLDRTTGIVSIYGGMERGSKQLPAYRFDAHYFEQFANLLKIKIF